MIFHRASDDGPAAVAIKATARDLGCKCNPFSDAQLAIALDPAAILEDVGHMNRLTRTVCSSHH